MRTDRNDKRDALSRQYEAAMVEHLKTGSLRDLKKGAVLGRKAVALGITILELAGMHDRALLLARPRRRGRLLKRLEKNAEEFFCVASDQIERAHPATTTVTRECRVLNDKLKKRTAELASSKRDVQRRIVQRKEVEDTLRSANQNYSKLWKESRLMQVSLRRLAHRVLAAQERERGQISRTLRDEIGQVLLGINLRLLALQQQGTLDANNLLREIAHTQRLVDNAVEQMGRAVAAVARDK